MRLITIVKTYEGLRVDEGEDKGARREWTATSALTVYLKGAFNPMEYAQAANLALNVAIDMHIPAIALKRVVKGRAAYGKDKSPETKKLF